MCRWFAPVLLAFVSVPVSAADTKSDANALSLQVTVLEMMHRFQATPEQLAELLKLAKEYAPKEAMRKAAKTSDKYRQTLTALRDAHVNGDDDLVTTKAAELEELKEKESPEIDDDVEVTASGRKGAAAVLKVFTPRQLALYISEFAEEFPDPLEKITTVFDDGRALKGKEWDEERDSVAEQVGWLVGGLDADAEAKITKKTADLLNRAHALKDAEYKAKKADLVKDARAITSAAGPMEVVQHFMERTAAELLSNPQAAAALEARLKKAK